MAYNGFTTIKILFMKTKNKYVIVGVILALAAGLYFINPELFQASLLQPVGNPMVGKSAQGLLRAEPVAGLFISDAGLVKKPKKKKAGMASSTACSVTPDDTGPVRRDAPICSVTDSGGGKVLEIVNDLVEYTDLKNQVVRVIKYDDMLASYNTVLAAHSNVWDGSAMADLLAAGEDLLADNDYYCGPSAYPPNIGANGGRQSFSVPNSPRQYDLAVVMGDWDWRTGSCWDRDHHGVRNCFGVDPEKIRFLRFTHDGGKKITLSLSRYFPNVSFIDEGWCR